MDTEILEMGRGRPVTEGSAAKKRLVVDLYHSRELTLEEIGEQVGLTRQRVSQILSEQGIEVEETNPDLSADIESILTLSGLSQTELAEILTVRRHVLNRWLRNGVSPDPRYRRKLRLLLAALERAKSAKP